MIAEPVVSPSRWHRWLGLLAAVGLVAVLALVLVRTAWLSDDAYITFRTADNFLNGYGLRWNIAERVQTYTHPLWLFFLIPVIAVMGNPFLAAVALSLLLTAVTIALVCARQTYWRACWVLTAMILSKAFIDYSTSGLENVLSHTLLAALMFAALKPADSPGRAGTLGLFVGLIGLTRLDLLLLAGPVGIAALRSWRRTFVPFVIGLAPLAAWEVFSIIYYGVPFPNTAYAKLGTNVDSRALLLQGVSYFLDSLNRDPVTLFVIGTAVTGTLLGGRGRRIPALAVLAYAVYVARIGGDFMSGRFFSAPFVVSLCLLTQLPWPARASAHLLPFAALLALGLTTERPNLFSDSSYKTPNTEVLSASGIVDERGFYFQNSGLIGPRGLRKRPDNTTYFEGRLLERTQGKPMVLLHNTVGLVGYIVGPTVHIVDSFALGDPLLARLPAMAKWRIGHYEREMPAGYPESLEQGGNLIVDPHIASLYEVIAVVTREPIWTWTRWKAILALNTRRTDGWPISRDRPSVLPDSRQ